MCGSGNGTATCICAQTVEGNGVCFDKDTYRCGDPSLGCERDVDCDVGNVCVADVCAGNCDPLPPTGICVGTAGCGDQGTNVMGALVRIGEMERRRRAVRGGPGK
jgi:hypothetical protein